MIEIEETKIRDVVLVKNRIFRDSRGYFCELMREDRLKDAGLDLTFVQCNQSGSVKNVVRGLHFQWEPPMGKMMRVSRGKAFLVTVDIRKGSPTLGQWLGYELTEDDKTHVYAPAGCARGFAALSDYAEIQYFTTGAYNGAGESGIAWNDPEVGVKWPVDEPLLSDKDVKAQSLQEWLKTPESDHFQY